MTDLHDIDFGKLPQNPTEFVVTGPQGTVTIKVDLVDSLRDVSAIERVECEGCEGTGQGYVGPCDVCSRRGWLYPDPPEWWSEFGFEGASNLARSEWIDFCNLLWRVLGMYGEADDGA